MGGTPVKFAGGGGEDCGNHTGSDRRHGGTGKGRISRRRTLMAQAQFVWTIPRPRPGAILVLGQPGGPPRRPAGRTSNPCGARVLPDFGGDPGPRKERTEPEGGERCGLSPGRAPGPRQGTMGYVAGGVPNFRASVIAVKGLGVLVLVDEQPPASARTRGGRPGIREYSQGQAGRRRGTTVGGKLFRVFFQRPRAGGMGGRSRKGDDFRDHCPRADKK